MKRVRKGIALFSLLALGLWLLPLGAFIKASEEAVACGGKRAFHCCMMSGKVHTDNSGKVSFSNAGSAEKTAKSSAAGGDDFVSSSAILARKDEAGLLKPAGFFIVPSFVQEVSAPPPKVLSLF